MEFRRLLVLYIASQSICFVLTLGLDILYAIIQNTGIGGAYFMVSLLWLMAILIFINIAMFLTLIEELIENKIKVFNKVQYINYGIYFIFLIFSANHLQTFIPAILTTLIGISTLVISENIYEKWVLESFNS